MRGALIGQSVSNLCKCRPTTVWCHAVIPCIPCNAFVHHVQPWCKNSLYFEKPQRQFSQSHDWKICFSKLDVQDVDQLFSVKLLTPKKLTFHHAKWTQKMYLVHQNHPGDHHFETHQKKISQVSWDTSLCAVFSSFNTFMAQDPELYGGPFLWMNLLTLRKCR